MEDIINFARNFCLAFCCDIDNEEYFNNNDSSDDGNPLFQQNRNRRRRSPRVYPRRNNHSNTSNSESAGGEMLEESEIQEYQIRELPEILRDDCNSFIISNFFIDHVKFLREDSSPSCVICLAEFELDQSQLIMLPCSHIYHKKCCITWFEQKYKEFVRILETHRRNSEEDILTHGVKCPVCRYELRLSSRTVIENKRIDRMKTLFSNKGYQLLVFLNRFEHVFINIMKGFTTNKKSTVGMREKVKMLKSSNGELMSLLVGLDSLSFNPSIEQEQKYRVQRKNYILEIQRLQEFVDEKLRNITVVY